MTIKLHPGADESDYSEFSGNAIKTTYSMEVMDINHDSAWDIIFTQCSSAAFNSYLVCGKHPVIVLLYKIINSDFISDGMIQFMESFRRNCTDVRVLVPTDMDELKIVLKSL